MDLSNISSPTTGVKLTVNRTPSNGADTARVSYNVNVLNVPNANLELAYASMLRSIATRAGYEFLGRYGLWRPEL